MEELRGANFPSRPNKNGSHAQVSWDHMRAALSELTLQEDSVRSVMQTFRHCQEGYIDTAKIKALHEKIVNDICGPQHNVYIEKEWLEWNGETIRKLAKAAKESRNFKVLPIIADAFEEAGCDNDVILNHLRADCHWYGCYLLEEILHNA